ncbi:Csu type fimbrial protein [Rhizobium halophytocola]|uniref:Spore coat protein U-like protein n=1 Tax=Rhizobium halophytocola TaxID=735519 RepID=A0ABS4E3V9_9HYPH|nr:spore coat protein U domain-containing protein [Rhizobium halophytocola]MBP1852589.1 spore coat protein U-like protein [Rhizobium halophytocola]
MPYANLERAFAVLFWIFLVAIMAAGPISRAEAATCSVAVDALNFGNVDTLSGLETSTTANVAISCSSVSPNARAVTICGNFGAGSGGASSSARKLRSGSHSLDFQLSSSSAGGEPWGSYSNTSLGAPQRIVLSPSHKAASGTITLYGTVLGGQPTAAAGSYASTFGAADTAFYYAEGTALNCSAPTSGSLAQTSFTASASVAGNCLIDVTDLNFGMHGVIDEDVTAEGSVDVTCTPGTAYMISMDGGLSGANDPQRRLMRSGTHTIAYGLYADSTYRVPWGNTDSDRVSGTGTGDAQVIPIYGLVEPQPAAAGSYNDTVVVTITYP